MAVNVDLGDSIGGLYLLSLISPPQVGNQELVVDFIPANIRAQKPDSFFTLEHASYRVIDPGAPTTTNAVCGMYLCTPDMQPGSPNIYVETGGVSSFDGKVQHQYLGPMISRANDTMLGTGKDESIPFTEDNANTFPLVIPPNWFVRFATFSFTGSHPTLNSVLNVVLAYRQYSPPSQRTSNVCA